MHPHVKDLFFPQNLPLVLPCCSLSLILSFVFISACFVHFLFFYRFHNKYFRNTSFALTGVILPLQE